MKLRNKKTGAIYKIEDIDLGNNADGIWLGMTKYNSLAELNEEWEDYEENEYYYAITSIKADGGITKMKNIYNDMTTFDKSIGNYFETKEEAEKAVEKLKDWKRLKDKGFKFDKISGCWIEFTLKSASSDEDFVEGQKDLDLLFGGEE